MKKIIVIIVLCALTCYSFAQQSAKLPHTIFFKLIDSTEMLSINHATEFKHVDVPKRMQNNFTSFMKDSVATEVSGLKSLLYYQYTMNDGSYIIGDIYFKNQASYIVFKINGKKYVNSFSKEGIAQLKSIFKL